MGCLSPPPPWWLGQGQSQAAQQTLGGAALAWGAGVEDALDRGLDGARQARVDTAPGRRETNRGPSAVGLVDVSRDQPGGFQPAEDPRHGTGIDVERRRECPGRDVRGASDDPDGQSLRSRDAEVGTHPLRGPLQAVIDEPQQTHEREDGW